MPFPCCRKQECCSKCRVHPSCSKCECEQRCLCPPFDENEQTQVIYAPVVSPARVNKCCVEKSRKSLWQQLFGEKKCCTCPKKKQVCCCKQKKKQINSDFSNHNCANFKPNVPQPCSSNICRPLCKCNNTKICCCTCTQNPSYPSARSICGCKFYCNIEDRPKRKRCRSHSPRKKKCFNYESPCREKCDDEEKETKTLRYGAPPEDEYKAIAPQDPRNYPDVKPKPKKTHSSGPTQSDIHIGLTLVSAETKYYKRNGNCPPIEEEDYNDDGESSEKMLTVEIRQSDGKLSKDNNEGEENPQKIKQEEMESTKSPKHERPSIVSEDHQGPSVTSEGQRKSLPKSEDYSRENSALPEKKSGASLATKMTSRSPKNTNEGITEGSLRSKREDTLNSDHRNSYLDRRVSEILKRLKNIENKINVGLLDSTRAETKKFKIDIDDAKSTISFLFKDLNDNNRNTKDNDNIRSYPNKADAIIEVRKTRSKSSPPIRRYSSTASEDSQYYSRSLDRLTNTSHAKPKIVIKLPNGKKISRGFVTVSNDNKIRQQSRDYGNPEWDEVSNELKKQNRYPGTQANSKCYCFECVCDRIKSNRR